jgi:hypothetical protein
MHDILVHVLAEHQQISPALEEGWMSNVSTADFGTISFQLFLA